MPIRSPFSEVSEGVRDPGLIETALYRPRTGYYGGAIEQAAALWESFAMNHPFMDGNKRVAFAVSETFLAINGIAITADSDAIYRFIMENLESGTFRHDRIVAWLRAHAARSLTKMSAHRSRLRPLF